MSIAGDVLKPKTSGPTVQAQDCKIFYHLFKINLFKVQKYSIYFLKRRMSVFPLFKSFLAGNSVYLDISIFWPHFINKLTLSCKMFHFRPN